MPSINSINLDLATFTSVDTRNLDSISEIRYENSILEVTCGPTLTNIRETHIDNLATGRECFSGFCDICNKLAQARMDAKQAQDYSDQAEYEFGDFENHFVTYEPCNCDSRERCIAPHGYPGNAQDVPF